MRRRSVHVVRVLSIFLAATLPLLSAAQLGPPPESSEEPTVDVSGDRRALIAAGASPGLFMVYSGDVIGYLDPCG